MVQNALIVELARRRTLFWYRSSQKHALSRVDVRPFRTIKSMSQAQHLRFEPKLLVDHVSPLGPRVTNVRGSLLLASLKLLKESGHYPTYEADLPKEFRDTIVYALAASWLPSAAFVAHYDTVDRLNLSDVQLSRVGEAVGAQILDGLFGSLVRTARNAGAEAGIWIALKQVERIWTRIYQGGGVAVVQTGPKDAIVEVSGLPIAIPTSRFFRISHSAFMRGSVMLVARACFVKPVPARKPHAETFAVSVSWV
jgi:hypothetical protein